MYDKENLGDAGQQETTARNSTIAHNPTDEIELSLEQRAQQRAKERRRPGGNGETPPDPARLFMSFRTLVLPHLDDPQTLDKLIAEFADTHKHPAAQVRRWLDDIQKEFAPSEEPPEEPISPKGGNGRDHDESMDWESQELPPLEAYADGHQDSRPVIHIRGGELPAMTDAAERALLADTSQPTIHQRDIQLVRTARVTSDSVTGHIRRQAGSLRVLPVDHGYLAERFTKAAVWLKWDGRTQKWKPADAPRSVVDTYLSRVGRWNCQALTGIIESPTLRPDGSILDVAGYDSKTGLIFDPGSTRFKPIPANPTPEDARCAVQVLREPFEKFPFIAEHDESVVLAAILTALIRPSLQSAPLFGFSAPVMASGKSLLGDSVALIATGRRAPAWTYTADADEERKHITSALLAGDSVVCIDNVSTPLDGDRLCSVLTQETITDRLLGVNKNVTLPTACVWMATGNNLEIRGDLSTRALVCRLDARACSQNI